MFFCFCFGSGKDEGCIGMLEHTVEPSWCHRLSTKYQLLRGCPPDDLVDFFDFFMLPLTHNFILKPFSFFFGQGTFMG